MTSTNTAALNKVLEGLRTDIAVLDTDIREQNTIKANLIGALDWMASPVPENASYRDIVAAVKKIPLDWYDRFLRLEENVPIVAAKKLFLKESGTFTANLVVSVKEGTGMPVSTDLNTVRTYMQGGLPDGAEKWFALNLNVRAPTSHPVYVTVEIKPGSSTSFDYLKEDVELVVREFFNPYRLGKEVIIEELKEEIIRRIPYYGYIEECRISSPAADIAVSPTILPVLGALTVTELTE